jgi:serine/threonine-protein kinase HipA
MGALTYEPAMDRRGDQDQAVALAQIYAAAVAAGEAGAIDLDQLAQVGASAGGARPKAVVALPRAGRGLMLAGAGEIPPTHEAWLVKFDLSRDGSAGPMEEAYARMARAAGIDLPETRLLETKRGAQVRRHFAVKRFDREGNRRIHHHTLAALCHTGAGDLNYEMFLRVTRRLTRDEAEVWRAFRRAAFNVLAGNRDDHGKNHGFLYDGRKWALGPAYDLTFIGASVQLERGMSIAGERTAANTAHLLKLAESEALDRRQAAAVIDEVRGAVGRWREFAEQSEVPALRISEVEHALKLGTSQRRGPSMRA